MKKRKGKGAGFKECKRCGQTKSKEDFTKSYYYEDKLSRKCNECLIELGIKSSKKICPICKNEKQFESNTNSLKCSECRYKLRIEWGTENKARVKELNIHRKFNITLEEFENMYFQQNGVCKICRMPEDVYCDGKVKDLSIDHCHKTGKIRGLLCQRCNFALGNFRDDIGIILSALEYLKEFINDDDSHS